MPEDNTPDPMPLQGEGDYISARRFDKEQAEFAKSGKVEPAARAAKEALDGPEAEDLEMARRSAAAGKTGKPKA
jgi:hypothetical protein